MMNDITRYASLGWDFDLTLWGHAKSMRFWNRILENPHRQTHHIITFRTGGLLDRLWTDLADAHCPLLPLHFRGIHGVPEEIYRAFVYGHGGGDRYRYWKGRVCRELGIECLIDDATLDVQPGCERYQIAHCHPDTIRI